MHPEGRMSFVERRKYLLIMQRRYKKASWKEKSRLLDEMEIVTGLHRKSLIRLMNSPLDIKRKPRRRERGPKYGPQVRYVISLIAKALDYPSAERLKPQLVTMARRLAAWGEIQVDQNTLAKLAQISESTVRRILDSISRDKPRPQARSTFRRKSFLRNIPQQPIPWDVAEPGHFEVDLVHHCGPSASGEYVCTLQMVDVATGWVELWAVLGRSYLVMRDAFIHILSRVPFPIKEIHPDNGSEFFNHHLLRFLRKALPQVRFSRNRPYHKNDNRFVEQRNHFVVRAYIGYDRLDTVAQTILLNKIYQKLWIYHNFFLPVRKTKEKIIIPSQGAKSKVKRVYDRARPPLERLEESEVVEAERLERLKRLRDSINPLRLREEIYSLIEELFSLPGTRPGVTENVYETLNLPLSLPEKLLQPVTLSFDNQRPTGNIII